MAQLEAALFWIDKAHLSIRSVEAQRQDSVLNEMIEQESFPKGWRWKEGDDRAAWRVAAQCMIDLTKCASGYVAAFQNLLKGDRYDRVEVDLPPGTRVTVRKDDEERVITSFNLKEQDNLAFFKQGKVVRIDLALPQDLRHDEPHNKQLIERLRSWIDRHAPQIDKLMENMNTFKEALMYGDQEVGAGTRGVFENDVFVGLAVRGYRPGPTQELREINLVGYDFDVDRLPNGNYRITQTVSAELAPWYAYQNIRLLGVSPVGKARVIESREVSGDEFIPVCSSSGNEFIQVKDAARFKAVKKASFCSEKALVATVDAAMLVSGLIECRAVYSAARIAATAANAELRLTTGQALLQGGSAVLRTTVAGLGVLNGAGGRAFSPGGLPVGDWINSGRSLYFLGDSALAVGRGGLNIYQWLKGSRSGVPGALSAAERVDALIHGLPARGGRAAIDGLPLAGPLHTATKHTFRAAEFLYAKQIGTDLLLQRQKLAEVGKRDAADDFKEFATGDKGIQDRIAKPNERAERSGSALTAERLENYTKMLSEGRSIEVQREITEIFNEAKSLLGDNVSYAERLKFLEKMASLLLPDGAVIREIDQDQGMYELPPLFTPDDRLKNWNTLWRNFFCTEKLHELPASLRNVVIGKITQKHPDIQTAVRLALLFVGELNGSGRSLVTIKVNVPGHVRYDGHSVEAADASMTITRSDIIGELRHDLAAGLRMDKHISDSHTSRIVIGDALACMGALPARQYGAVLQDVLNSTTASVETKMRALSDPYGPRLAALAELLLQVDNTSMTKTERLLDSVRTFGLTPNDFGRQLEKLGRTAQDPAVRAMAAAQWYGLQQHDKRFLMELDRIWQNHKGTHEEFAAKITLLLESQISPQSPEGDLLGLREQLIARKLNAARALALMTPKEDSGMQQKINAALADCFKVEFPHICELVTETFLPERYRDLAAIDRKSAEEFAEKLVGMVSTVPGKPMDEVAVINLLSKIKLIADQLSSRLRDKLITELSNLLDGNHPKGKLCQDYGGLQVAAIEALADLNASNTVRTIRCHVSSMMLRRQMPGGFETLAPEENAEVRLAAAKALRRLRDPEIMTYLSDLIDTETDPRVAMELRQIDAFEEPMEKTSKRYRKITEEVAAKAVFATGEASLPHLKEFSIREASSFLDQKFNLLDHRTFIAQAQGAIDNSQTRAVKTWTSRQTIVFNETEAATRVADERIQQWRQLKNSALEAGADADKAVTVFKMIAAGTQLSNKLGLDGQAVGLISHHYADEADNGISMYHPHYRLEAAEVLKEVCERGHFSKDVLLAYLEELLVDTGSADPKAQFVLLQGLECLHRKGVVDDVKLCELYNRMLVRRAGKNANGLELASEMHLQCYLINRLGQLKYPAAVPVIDGFTNSTAPTVAETARNAMRELESVNSLWERTVAEQLTSTDRFTRLATAFALATADELGQRFRSMPADMLVLEIAKTCKNHRFSASEDDRKALSILQAALRHGSERVRLAAAKVLIESNLTNDHPAKVMAIKALHALTMRGSNDTYRAEALLELKTIDLTVPIKISLSDESSGKDRLLVLEKKDGGFSATEYLDGDEAGFTEPNGHSLRILKDAGGEVVGFYENGQLFKREKTGWRNDRTKELWKGEIVRRQSVSHKGKVLLGHWARQELSQP